MIWALAGFMDQSRYIYALCLCLIFASGDIAALSLSTLFDQTLHFMDKRPFMIEIFSLFSRVSRTQILKSHVFHMDKRTSTSSVTSI